MGERAKILVNEYIAIELLQRKDLDLDKFYNTDLKVFINSAKKEIERLNNKIAALEKENAVLKTLVPSNQRYSYGIR